MRLVTTCAPKVAQWIVLTSLASLGAFAGDLLVADPPTDVAKVANEKRNALVGGHGNAPAALSRFAHGSIQSAASRCRRSMTWS